MLLDIRTVIATGAGLGVLIALSLRYVLRDYPAMLGPSMREWMLGISLQALSWGLVAVRGLVPDIVSVVLANALLSIGYAVMVDAVRRFLDLRGGHRMLYGLVAASICVQLFFTYEVPNTRVRILIGSSLFAALLPYALLPLLGAYRRTWRRSYLLTAAGFAILLAIMLVRVLYEGLNAEGLNNALLSTPMQALVFGALAIFPAVGTLGFLLMCSSRLYQELERQATVDALTGINNRRTLDELAGRAIAAAHRHKRSLAVLLIDADHFKRINDVHGHEVGDDALRCICAALKRGLRAEDLFGRLGGEEFVVVLPDADETAALASAERLRQAVEQAEFSAERRAVPLRISIGVAIDAPDDDFASLLRRADQALYAAKRAGRNRVIGPSDPPPDPLPAASLLAG
ncbi:MAG TPA: GGDEF domain-containing protein [Rudaea sp.]|nr:GGDEF domain-containing protein [Rudaea sp.]